MSKLYLCPNCGEGIYPEDWDLDNKMCYDCVDFLGLTPSYYKPCYDQGDIDDN